MANAAITNHKARWLHNRAFIGSLHVKRYQQIWKHYRELYNASQTTRYHCTPGDWIPAKDIKAIWIPDYLYPIEKSVQKLTGDAERLPLITWSSPPATATPTTSASS